MSDDRDPRLAYLLGKLVTCAEMQGARDIATYRIIDEVHELWMKLDRKED